jgi:hypothetical protein
LDKNCLYHYVVCDKSVKLNCFKIKNGLLVFSTQVRAH